MQKKSNNNKIDSIVKVFSDVDARCSSAPRLAQ
jgi:hypothetical protein